MIVAKEVIGPRAAMKVPALVAPSKGGEAVRATPSTPTKATSTKAQPVLSTPAAPRKRPLRNSNNCSPSAAPIGAVMLMPKGFAGAVPKPTEKPDTKVSPPGIGSGSEPAATLVTVTIWLAPPGGRAIVTVPPALVTTPPSVPTTDPLVTVAAMVMGTTWRMPPRITVTSVAPAARAVIRPSAVTLASRESPTV